VTTYKLAFKLLAMLVLFPHNVVTANNDTAALSGILLTPCVYYNQVVNMLWILVAYTMGYINWAR